MCCMQLISFISIEELLSVLEEVQKMARGRNQTIGL